MNAKLSFSNAKLSFSNAKLSFSNAKLNFIRTGFTDNMELSKSVFICGISVTNDDSV